jgi:hypothetical protein
MLYAILAYHDEDVVVSWTADQDTSVMTGLHEIHEKLTADGQMGPAARLGGTKGAFTLRGPGAGVVIDGPFAETKEQLLGFYVIDCATRDDAIAIARDLRRVNPSAVYEIRPIQLFLPGAPKEATHALSDHVRGGS